MFQLTAEELAGIVAVVVGFTEMVKLSKMVPERFGLLIAAVFSALGILAYASSKPELLFTRAMIWPFISAYLVVLTAAAGVYGVIRESRGADVVDASKKLMVVMLLGGTVTLIGCGGKSAPVLVGESAIVTSRFIQEASNAVMSLVPSPLSPQKALVVQDNLKVANDEIKKLIPVLRAIDAAQKAGDPAQAQVEQALVMAQSIATSLNLSVKGVPLADAAAKLLEVVNNARGAIATVQATLDALRARRSGDLVPAIRELEHLMTPEPAVVAA